MYACFEGISQEVRQQAFDEYVMNQKQYMDKLLSDIGADMLNFIDCSSENLVRSEVETPDGKVLCCPFGAINNELARTGRLQLPAAEVQADESGLAFFVPYADVELKILQRSGVTASLREIRRFIDDNDHHCFPTFAELAEAMVVEHSTETT